MAAARDSVESLAVFEAICLAIADGAPPVPGVLPDEAAGAPPSPLAQLRWILEGVDEGLPFCAEALRDPLAPHW